MALIDLWQHSKDQLQEKHVHQIIAVSGEGKLLDGKDASTEFRAFLSQVPSALLKKYADECLTAAFADSGLALQDVMNEVGHRLGFQVAHGRYRGTSSSVGFDGIWRMPGGGALVIEVKTTDAYRIDLNKIAGYRKALTTEGTIPADASSVLIIVGRQDTGDLEAQIRGSRHAWDMRVVSVDAMLRLLEVKEEVEDPQLVKRMHEILVPREFTRLDDIVDILFSAAEDIKLEDASEAEDEEAAAGNHQKKPKFKPVAFHEACIPRIEKCLQANLLKRSRATYSTADGTIALTCAVSREHMSASSTRGYWFAFHPHQKEFLESAQAAYTAFGCGSEKQLLLFPYAEFAKHLDGFHTTHLEDRFYWHVRVVEEDGCYHMIKRKGEERADVTKYLLPAEASS